MIQSVIWPTKNRVECLQRCLRSFLPHRQGQALLVFDDAEDPAPCRAMLQATVPDAVHYDRARKTTLLPQHLDKELAQFAVFGLSEFPTCIGANRNAGLLATCDENIMMIDDDMECQVTTPGSYSPRLSKSDPTKIEVYSNETTALQAHPLSDANIIEMQTPLGEMTAAGMIRMSQFGVIGDCGMSTPQWHMLPPRMLQADFPDAIHSRIVCRAAPHLSYSQTPTLMTGAIGLRNRWLPPFMPAGRASDDCFAGVVMRMYPGTLVAHLPAAMLHRPVKTNLLNPVDCIGYRQRTIGQLMSLLLARTTSPINPDARDRLKSVGKQLESLICGDFLALLSDIFQASDQLMADYLDLLWPQVTANQQIYLNREIQARQYNSQHPQPLQFSDAPDLQAVQKCVGLYAGLLQTWF